MKIIIKPNTNNVGSATTPSISLSNPFYINGVISLPTHGLNKLYVDNAYSNLNANNITGTISSALLPSFNLGDLVNTQGSNVFSLINIHSTPISGYVPTVDGVGRVSVVNANVSDTNISNIGFNKITNKPTTLAGYGITDGININTANTLDPNVTILVNGTINSPMHVSTYEYLSSRSGSTSIPVGTIVKRPKITNDVNFLNNYKLCNGAILSKSAYPELYNVIGNKYRDLALQGAGKPWLGGAINNPALKITNPFVTDPNITLSSMPFSKYGINVVVTKSKVYFIGGGSWPSYQYGTTFVYSADLDVNGVITTNPVEEPSLRLPKIAYYRSSIIVNNYIYLFLKDSGTDTNHYLYRAKINTITGNIIPGWMYVNKINFGSAEATPSLIYTKDKLYAIFTEANRVFRAELKNDNVGNFVDLTATTGYKAFNMQILYTQNQRKYVKIGNYIYGIIIGYQFHLVYIVSAPILSNGDIGQFKHVYTIGSNSESCGIVIIGTTIYLIGGIVSFYTVSSNSILELTTDGFGGISSATTMPNMLPVTMDTSSIFVTSSRIYSIGGYNHSTSSNLDIVAYSPLGNAGYNEYLSITNTNIDQYANDPNFALPDYTAEDNKTGLYSYIRIR